ncbi:class I SAM-dependent methyltransferase [Sediminicoccus sp. BL-A-41-H5]|uniref:class I SAM-dependent methyltransferase n=1 Tax=Sediminicoccus sp. BL-A-41-H5 TaxID=3421106 RepID=UPI003D67AC2E
MATYSNFETILRSEADFSAFYRDYSYIFEMSYAEAIAQHACAEGVESAMLGRVTPERVLVSGPNLRECLNAAGFNPRLRAVMEMFTSHAGSQSRMDLRIYAHEAVTAFSLLFRGLYPKFLGSEYASDAATAASLYPIPCVDITASGLPANTFDVVLSNEVLEHVPDLDAALRDTCRILKPHGRLIGTFPFTFRQQTTVKAVLEGGRVRYLTTPEYHGNPIDPNGGSLVFQVPGWDIIDRARDAGFRDAWFTLIASFPLGITPVLVFQAER